VKGVVEQVAPETFERRPLGLPAVGQRVRVHAVLYVMPAHEADLASDAHSTAPGLVRDWRVRSVAIERRSPGRLVTVEPVDRMDAWTDEDSGGEYLLDVSKV
jgi:hypothetical protein